MAGKVQRDSLKAIGAGGKKTQVSLDDRTEAEISPAACAAAAASFFLSPSPPTRPLTDVGVQQKKRGE